MTTDAIFHKYASALYAIQRTAEDLEPQTVMLALRLAVQDAYAAGAALCDDLAAIVASQAMLQQQLAQLDADNADLTVRLRTQAGAIEEAARLRQEIADLREQVIPDYQARLAEADRHGNGNGANPTPAAQADAWGRNHPAWAALPAADLAVIDQLSSGQIKFRSLSKTLRRDLVHRAIQYLAATQGSTPTSSEWDRQRPLWLPTQGAVILLASEERWPTLVAEALNLSPATA